MSIFGKKNLSLEDILKGIESLSEEDKAKVIESLQPSTEPEEPTSVEETAVEEPVEEIEEVEAVEETEMPEEEATEAVAEDEQGMEETEETMPVEETDVDPIEEVEEIPEPMPENPMETPEPEMPQANGNYDELIAAQNAKIDALESQLAAFKETLETVLKNQENQNFGYSPKADFSEDQQATRMSAVMQGYAPRRYEQYK